MTATAARVVFLSGEGPNDIGHFAKEPMYQAPARGRRRAQALSTGLVPPIVRRIANEQGIEIRLEGRKITHLPKQRKRSRAAERAIDARLRGAIAIARTMDAELVVFLADTDDRHHAAMLKAILAALPSDDDGAPAILVGLPKAMIEAWALAAPEVIEDLAEDDGEEVPRWPERLWGDKHDPSSNYPKHVLKRCLGHDYTSEELASIGEQADLDVMAQRCPESFAPFLERARAIAAACANGAK